MGRAILSRVLEELTQAESASDAVEALSTLDRGLKDLWEAYKTNTNTLDVERFVDCKVANSAVVVRAWLCRPLDQGELWVEKRGTPRPYPPPLPRQDHKQPV